MCDDIAESKLASTLPLSSSSFLSFPPPDFSLTQISSLYTHHLAELAVRLSYCLSEAVLPWAGRLNVFSPPNRAGSEGTREERKSRAPQWGSIYVHEVDNFDVVSEAG